jgi:hypothetical protein
VNKIRVLSFPFPSIIIFSSPKTNQQRGLKAEARAKLCDKADKADKAKLCIVFPRGFVIISQVNSAKVIFSLSSGPGGAAGAEARSE